MIKIDENIIKHLHKTNGDVYNMHKTSEELLELALVLTQKLTKANKIDDQEIIDEIGDVLLRMEIIKLMFSKNKIQKRIDYKLSKWKEYIDYKEYKQI